MLSVAAATSMRVAAKLLNSFLHLAGAAALSERTLANKAEREGLRIIKETEDISAAVLVAHDFNPETGLPNTKVAEKEAMKGSNAKEIDRETILCAINEHNKTACKEAQLDAEAVDKLGKTSFEEGSAATSVSVDDILVSKQKETGRAKNSVPMGNHWVTNTVIQIQSLAGTYRMVGSGMTHMFLVLMAFLLHNKLLENKMLVFFTDGAKNIKNAIERMFGWRQYVIILDWYHLEKKCGEYLSMALKGIKVRKTVWATLGKLLWIGEVAKAIAYIESLGKELIKNATYIDKVIEYLEKNKEFIPCYAIRKRLGLRNSSNPVETTNNMVVASRQKANGMSWSNNGSVSIANVTAVIVNKGLKSWVSKRDLDFRLVGREEQDRAA